MSEQLQVDSKPEVLEESQAMIFDYEKWYDKLPEMKARYQTDDPYPHIVEDNFMEEWAAEKVRGEFPSVKDDGWIHYVHFNEKKHGLNKLDLLPPFIQETIREFNSPRFVSYLSELTGIDNLIADDQLEGGGLHQSLRNGFLNVHADFTVHPHKRNYRRRVNLLVYFNKDWKPEYKGDLELWTRDMKVCSKSVSPIFNRCVVFNTDEDSYHGLPEPIMCPEDDSRKSIALYYFTEEKEQPKKQTTKYRARPKDGMRSLLIYLDNKVVTVYSLLKSKLGINDDFVSKVLNKFSGKK
ncbi:2OG-Fe(II) oxygenase [Aureibacter tunicatorum]|uniref:Rps23 Pro-64 3,4-dihydroxylase Tpa1-like proline 4-hydroxylase n=1 Tax=Aureibacter tunicatorum TaxID=866807 RepID=A0AAE3XS89_9BACT|nr:2OG-Fe(II) oxygenase [Aureibacter tunicatorum]MDR6241035.1 Rps23 Pro-64 3,4-dihydroxylase Tpa1-like proline 4-hydroxylase [Aureibacter tunicatorum]BDD03813.1 hypothetical protein AUTU_12960 [Aureibacter tunicatorum]